VAETIIAEEVGSDDPASLPLVEETTDVLTRRLLGMPRFLAGGMAAMTLGFDRLGVEGTPFHRLDLHARRAALARVRGVPIGIVHNFVSFYDKLGVFIFWSLVEDREKPS